MIYIFLNKCSKSPQFYCIVVSGDANFSMDITSLTIGGFTQPTVARNLIELQASAEKGLSPRFLWIFPKPTYAQFETLEKVDESFTHSLGKVKLNIHSCIQCTCISL